MSSNLYGIHTGDRNKSAAVSGGRGASSRFLALFFVYASLLLCGLASSLFAQNDGSQQNILGKPGVFLIRGARVVTVSGDTIENGSVLIRDGKIAAVGVNLNAPSDQVIDGKGLSVYPGMIDAGTNLGLTEIPLGVNATVDVAETGDMNANAKALLGVNPYSSHVNVARINGITSVMAYPTGGIITGQSAVINLWGSTQNEMALVPAFGLVVNFPRITTFGGFGGGGQTVDFNEAIKQRDKRIDDLKKIFRDALAYGDSRDASRKDKRLPYFPIEAKMESMVRYARGERPVIFIAERERDIRAAARFAADMKVKGIILGGQEAWKAADVLTQNDIAVIFTNIYQLPVQDDDPYDYLYEAPSKMQKAGVRFCISTGNDGAEVRDLPYHAGLASSFGLSPQDALKSVTLYPAQILGVADKLGSVEVGKAANLVITDGDLLEPRTNVKYLFINGRLIPLTSRHTELLNSFKDRK
jgi:imidazolonepropionase-like amidohydrolase